MRINTITAIITRAIVGTIVGYTCLLVILDGVGCRANSTCTDSKTINQTQQFTCTRPTPVLCSGAGHPQPVSGSIIRRPRSRSDIVTAGGLLTGHRPT